MATKKKPVKAVKLFESLPKAFRKEKEAIIKAIVALRKKHIKPVSKAPAVKIKIDAKTKKLQEFVVAGNKFDCYTDKVLGLCELLTGKKFPVIEKKESENPILLEGMVYVITENNDGADYLPLDLIDEEHDGDEIGGMFLVDSASNESDFIREDGVYGNSIDMAKYRFATEAEIKRFVDQLKEEDVLKTIAAHLGLI